jgi:hypothetical protein
LIHAVDFSTDDSSHFVVPVAKIIKHGETLIYSSRETDTHFPKYMVVGGETFFVIRASKVYNGDLYSIFFTKDHPLLKAHASCPMRHIFKNGIATVTCFSLKDNRRFEKSVSCTAALIQVPNEKGEYFDYSKPTLTVVEPCSTKNDTLTRPVPVSVDQWKQSIPGILPDTSDKPDIPKGP